ncbi:MAG: hypothetical protein M0P14_00775 [Alkaliphilus sp.]|nr:hypothetical protein [Alkaliphilus sp.]
MAKKKEQIGNVTVDPNRNTAILPCSCDHIFQDKKYGNGKRLHNKARGKGGTGCQWRCTVCLSVK